MNNMSKNTKGKKKLLIRLFGILIVNIGMCCYICERENDSFKLKRLSNGKNYAEEPKF